MNNEEKKEYRREGEREGGREGRLLVPVTGKVQGSLWLQSGLGQRWARHPSVSSVYVHPRSAFLWEMASL